LSRCKSFITILARISKVNANQLRQGMRLWQVAAEISRRLVRHFPARRDGRRPVRRNRGFSERSTLEDLILFYEYFHGDNGAASAQVIRPAGLAWWPSSSNKVASDPVE